MDPDVTSEEHLVEQVRAELRRELPDVSATAPGHVARALALAAAPATPPRPLERPVTPLRRRALVGLATTLTLLLATSGMAMAGALPAPAQDALARAAERAGFSLPASDDAAVDEDASATTEESDGTSSGDESTTGEETTSTSGDEGDASTGTGDEEADGPPADNHGAEVSAVAKDDSLSGREHGQAVAEVASGGKAGGTSRPEHAGPPEGAGKPDKAGPPADSGADSSSAAPAPSSNAGGNGNGNGKAKDKGK